MFIGTRSKKFVLIAMRRGAILKFARRPYIPALWAPAGAHFKGVHWQTVRDLLSKRYIVKVSGDMRRSHLNAARFALTTRGERRADDLIDADYTRVTRL